MAAAGTEGISGVGRLIRAGRQQAGLTQHALANLVGVSVATVRDLEQGRTQRPRAALLDRLATVLDLEQGQRQDPGYLEPPPGSARPGTGLWLYILGPVTAWRDGQPLQLAESRQRAVLGLLALNAGTSVHRSSLVDALWENDPPAAAVNLVQAYVGGLRRVIDPGRSPRDEGGLLVSTGTSYRLRIANDHLDWLAFRAQVRRAAAVRESDTRGRCDAYEQAMRLWRGDPLADLEVLRGHPSVMAATREWPSAVSGYAEAALRAGTPERVLPYLWQWLGGDSLNEKACALLMLSLAGTGQQATALEVFAQMRDRLDAQLGIRPGPELSGAHLRILRRETGTVANRATGNPAGQVPRQLPAPVNHFVGRVKELKILDDLTDAAGGIQPAIAAITGTAGVGKTALALHWARRVGVRFPDGQLYVNLRGFGPDGDPLGPAQVLRGFLNALGVPAGNVSSTLDGCQALYRSVLAGRRVLVVLDNARDAAQVRPLLPGAADCAAVITSRSELTGLVAADGARAMLLDLLTGAEARLLLAGRLGAARLTAEPAAAADLVELCARLPLALAITAARAAARPGFPLAVIAAELRDCGSRLDALATGEPTTDTRAVLSWSYRMLSDPAARMFRLLGLHRGPDITAEAAASLAGVPVSEARRLLRELTGVHLLAEPVCGRYAVHDLLRAYAVEQVGIVEPDEARHAATGRMLDHYLHTAHAAALLLSPSRTPVVLAAARAGVTAQALAGQRQALAWFEAERAVLLAVVAQAAGAGFDEHAWQLPWAMADFLDRRGHWHDSAAAQRTALAAATRLGNLLGQASAGRALGKAYTWLGEYTRAGTCLFDSLGGYGRLGDQAGQARVHQSLMWVAERQGRYRDALSHAEDALALFEVVGDRAGQAAALNAVGWCQLLLGDPEQARASCRHALALNQESGNRRGVALTWDSVGYAEHALGHFAEAADCFHRALGLFRECDDRFYQAETLTHLGDTHQAAGNPEQARRAWRQALHILDDLGHANAAQLRSRLEDLMPQAVPA